MVPLLSLLYGFLIGLILYIVFKFMMGYSDRLSQISGIFAGCFICIYLIIINEIKNLSLFKK